LWHAERFAALGRINQGAWSNGLASLVALHRRAEQRPILGTEPFCAFDRVVLFSELAETASLDERVRGALEYDASEPPRIWALKVRALASAGLAGEARAALRVVSPQNLAKLPCDHDYLGTLAHVARAALELQALDYVEAVKPLLAPFPERFAVQISFLCEGSVSQLLGMLDHALGDHVQAEHQLRAGIQHAERAGFAPRAAEARLELARCLLAQGKSHEDEALAYAHESQTEATRMGMQRLATAAADWLRSA